MKTRPIRVLGGTAAAAALLALAYPAMLRGRCLHWGATPEEVSRRMPGDDLVDHPDLVSTRAIGIAAPPEAVWPWLVQMGSGRGGAYTYDWIENLFGLNMHSANEILPEYQDLKLGDVLPLGDRGPRLRVEVLEPNRALTFVTEDGDWAWLFGLYPDGASTRLVSRNLIALPRPTLGRKLLWLYVMEPGSLVMERRMLRGIKARAERTTRSTEPQAWVPAEELMRS